MKPSVWLSLVILFGTTQYVSAQPSGYFPGAAPLYYGSGAFPYQVPPAVPWYPMAPRTTYPVPSETPSREPATASPAPTAPVASATPSISQPPELQAAAVLKEGMDKLLAYLGQPELPNQLQVAAFLDREVAPYFDFDYMARWAAGPLYAEMPDQERRALAAGIEREFLGTLASRLAGYQGQQVRVLAPRPSARGAVTINVAVLRAGDYPATLQFRLYKSSRGWKAYDVLANGQSAAAHYRVQFQRLSAGGSPLRR
jgi:phospholipid transport system substrate-binding protein